MEKSIFHLRFILRCFGVTLLLSGCLKDKVTRTYTIYRPVYKEKSEVLAAIRSKAPVPLGEPGKIYTYGRYIFLNEVSKGVHIIDNGDPAKPLPVKFISIPGNVDIAVKGNVLYADLFTDLLAIDISDPLQAKLTKVVPNVFSERRYISGFVPESTKVIVGWIKKDTTVEEDNNFSQSGCRNCNFASTADFAKAAAPGPGSPGTGGSMARFAIVNDYLYTVNTAELAVFGLSVPDQPALLGKTSIGWNIETVYPFKTKLFIGSGTGMFIYDITDPAQPRREGMFSHARACDPVVADDEYAYVTLRTGNACAGTSDQLDVLDIRNVNTPHLLRTYPLTNPYGLAKEGDALYVCDGRDGLRIYNAAKPNDLQLIGHLKGMETYDAIARDNKLLLVSKDGLYQYDVSRPKNPQLLSKLSMRRY